MVTEAEKLETENDIVEDGEPVIYRNITSGSYNLISGTVDKTETTLNTFMIPVSKITQNRVSVLTCMIPYSVMPKADNYLGEYKIKEIQDKLAYFIVIAEKSI